MPGLSIKVRLPVAAMAATCVALVTGAARPAVAQFVIEGRVLDDETEAPLVGARVFLLNRYNRVAGYKVTDEAGKFRFEKSSSGRFRLEISAVGYRQTITPVLWMMEDRAFAGLEVRLTPNVVLLAPVEIVALAPRATSPVLEHAMFRRTRGLGTHITRQEIEDRGPANVTDMLLELPGLYASRRGTGASGRTITMSRSLAGPAGGSCPVQIWVDGMLATVNAPGGDVFVDELVTPQDVEMIEVFRGLGTVPAEFLNPYARCGVIAIWTKRTVEPPQ